MTGFSEADREQLAVDTLGEREWRKLSGTQIAPGAEGGRQSWDDVVLVGRMLNKMRELNPDVPAEYLDQAHAAIIQPQSQDQDSRHGVWVGSVVLGFDLRISRRVEAQPQ